MISRIQYNIFFIETQIHEHFNISLKFPETHFLTKIKIKIVVRVWIYIAGYLKRPYASIHIYEHVMKVDTIPNL